MCGRFTLKTAPDQWGQLLLPIIDRTTVTDWRARYNIAPTQPIIAIVQDAATGGFLAQYFRWGLIPSWANDVTIGNRMINARAETVAEKPSFRKPLAQRRCAVIADGYYEWKQVEKRKQPYWIHRPDMSLFAMAGLWETNAKAAPTAIQSCALITTSASLGVSPVHDRMPVMLLGSDLRDWLDPTLPTPRIQSLLKSAPDDFLEAYPVDMRVNSAKFDGPESIERISP